MPVLDAKRLARLYKEAKADRWSLSSTRFGEALEASVAKAFAGHEPAPAQVERYLSSVHLEDLALACACAEGHEAAWELVVREYRAVLYRSADALDATGGSREIADSVYGELYERSLFRYFHGRSSLATWLRSVLAQRYVDQVRSRKRLDPLPEEETGLGSAAPALDPASPRYYGLVERILRDAVAKLPARDRLRLGCYYVRQMTLAETGRLLHEHEATVSRQLARTRRALRDDMVRGLGRAGLSDDEIQRCVELVSEDVGPLDLDKVFAGGAGGKIPQPDRSEGG